MATVSGHYTAGITLVKAIIRSDSLLFADVVAEGMVSWDESQVADYDIECTEFTGSGEYYCTWPDWLAVGLYSIYFVPLAGDPIVITDFPNKFAAQSYYYDGTYLIPDWAFKIAGIASPVADSGEERVKGIETTIGVAGVGLTEVRVSDAGLAEFATNDTGETVGADGSVAKISQGTLSASGIADAVWNALTATHTVAGSFGLAITTLTNRIGAFTGTGANTVLGFLKAGLSKNATTPSDIGGTFTAASDANEAIKDQLNKVPTRRCVTFSASTGEIEDSPRTVFQYEIFGPEVWTIVDQDGDPIDLSSADLEFRVYSTLTPETVLWTLDSSGTSNGTIVVTGDDSNIVTVTDDDDTNLQTDGQFRYVLWDTTSDKVRARGTLDVTSEADSV